MFKLFASTLLMLSLVFGITSASAQDTFYAGASGFCPLNQVQAMADVRLGPDGKQLAREMYRAAVEEGICQSVFVMSGGRATHVTVGIREIVEVRSYPEGVVAIIKVFNPTDGGDVGFMYVADPALLEQLGVDFGEEI